MPYFSPFYFASAGADRTARLWSTDRVQPLRLFVGEEAGRGQQVIPAVRCSRAKELGQKNAYAQDLQATTVTWWPLGAETRRLTSIPP